MCRVQAGPWEREQAAAQILADARNAAVFGMAVCKAAGTALIQKVCVPGDPLATGRLFQQQFWECPCTYPTLYAFSCCTVLCCKKRFCDHEHLLSCDGIY